jgi:hypothetical protein
LRPRSDLVNTLLHEMIHAFLFLTSGSMDRDGHGQDFLYHSNVSFRGDLDFRAEKHISKSKGLSSFLELFFFKLGRRSSLVG